MCFESVAFCITCGSRRVLPFDVLCRRCRKYTRRRKGDPTPATIRRRAAKIRRRRPTPLRSEGPPTWLAGPAPPHVYPAPARP